MLCCSFQLARAPSRELVALLENSETVSGQLCRDGVCGDPQPEQLDTSATARLRRHAATGPGNKSRGRAECPGCAQSPASARPSCRPAAMEQLRARCEVLLDSCISPLALQLTDKELAELREKLEAEVCSYLSCDRYWSVDRSKRSLNIGAVLLVTITTAVLYLLFVYHLVWVWYGEGDHQLGLENSSPNTFMKSYTGYSHA